jgi:hypothetical protein
LIFSPKLVTINLEPVFGWFVNRTRRKNAMRIHILALALGLGVVSTLMAEPPPRDICFSQITEQHIQQDWLLTSFDLPPPTVEGVFAATISQEGHFRRAQESEVTAQWNIVAIIDTAPGVPMTHIIRWSDKGHDTFRAVEALYTGIIDEQRPTGKRRYLTDPAYRHPLLC